MIVTFDIADGSFDYYSKEAWKTQLTSWRLYLEADGYEGSEALDAEEVVEMMYGEEMFFDEVGIEKIK